MQKQYFFEIDDFSIDEDTGERFPAGVRTTVEEAGDLTDEQVAKMLADRFGIAPDRFRAISEEKYMEEYEDTEDDGEWVQ